MSEDVVQHDHSTHRPIALLDLESQRRRVGPRVDEAIRNVISHGRFIFGPEVTELEAALSARVPGSQVVTCASGTDALQLALMAWGVGRGDAVFVPDFTYTATAEVVTLLGATPIFCDVHEDSYNLKVESLESAVRWISQTGSLRPRVVIPVDLFGHPSDVGAVESIAERYGLKVLVDAAQSFGACSGGRPVGSFGHATATSFFPSKPLGCYGDGGALFTSDSDLASQLRALRAHGTTGDKYYPVMTGLNSRLDTIQAAILLAKLDIFDSELTARRRLASLYDRRLAAECPEVGRPVQNEGSAWAQFTIRLPASAPRPDVRARLSGAGIPTAVYYPFPLHEVPANSSGLLLENGCSGATELSRSVLSLPLHPYLTDQDIGRVVDALALALGASPE